MEIGLVGLGKMGGNMARRWMRGGHSVTGYARSAGTMEALRGDGLAPAKSLEALVAALRPPRAVWLMLPAGDATEETIKRLSEILQPGDSIIDGGNTYYKDDIRRATALAPRRIDYVDQGTSGGIWGLDNGYCLMIGGQVPVIARLKPAFVTLAPAADRGWAHVGPVGSGHFVKMVHNGIEYGLMQSYAEGFALLDAKSEFGLNLEQIARVWQDGSVVRSWLLDLAVDALSKDPKLAKLEAFVADSGEGRWTVAEGIDRGVPTPVIALSLMARLRSQLPSSFADRLLAALRNEFGGHAVKEKK